MWRKRRMQHFLSTEMKRCRLDPDHAAYDEAHALRAFSECITYDPDQFEHYAFNALRPYVAGYLRRKYPRENFKSTLAWGRAIQEEVMSVLVPHAESAGESNHVMMSRDGAFFTQDVIKHELTLDERIDAMIDRAIERLVQAKAMKEMLGTTSQVQKPSERK